jgi:hypothetical protein
MAVKKPENGIMHGPYDRKRLYCESLLRETVMLIFIEQHSGITRELIDGTLANE